MGQLIVESKFYTFFGEMHLTQNWACFEHHLKII